jgi:ABC-type oligopeptide transport system substrate-binding subunit
MQGYDPAAGDTQRFDAAAAKATLASAGVSPDALRGIHLLSSQFYLRDAQLFQDQIKQNLGLDMTIDAIGDFPTLNTMLRQGNFQLYAPTYAHQAVYPGPADFLDIFLSNAGNPNNATRWKNAQYDDLVQQADASPDLAKRQQLFGQAQRILLQEAPVAVISQVQNYVFFKPWVQGLVRTAHDDTFLPGDFYITKMFIAKH